MALRHPLRAVLRSDQVSGSAHALGAALGHEFTRPELLQQALTHPSATAKSTYERLEFLGDRVLGLVIADMVYRAYPAEPEGALARRFTALVRKEALARVAETIDLGSHLRVSRAEAEQGGRGSHNLLADACEAMIASEGPPHDPTFEIEVSLPGRTPAQGRGRSRRAAESAAANALFSLLKDE